MRYSDFDAPRGTAYVRSVIARALNANAPEAVRYAADRWGADSLAYITTKAATGASAQESELIRAGEMQVEFLEAVKLATAMDRLPLRRVPANVPGVTVTTPATAVWRGQGKAVRVSEQAFDRTTMTALSIGALVVVTDELLRDSSAEAEALILRDLVKALADGTDASFFDADNGGTSNVEPASVTNGAASVASSGTLVTDLQTAFAEFSGQWSTAAFVCNPKLAVDIGLLYGSKGLAVDLGARGGTLCGLPVYVTEGLGADSSGTGDLVLIDGAGVMLVDEGAQVSRSNVTTLEMDVGPTMDSLAPTSYATTAVSMFQAESTALLASRRLNWRVARTGSVVTITDCAYAPAS